MYHTINYVSSNQKNITSKEIVFLLILLFVMFSCSTPNEITTKTDTEQRLKDSLAFELCQIYGSDQVVRHITLRNKQTVRLQQHTDTINFYRLVEFVKKNGFPTKKILGEENYSFECVGAAALSVLLHNPHRLVNEKEYLDLFLNEVEKGNLKRKHLALILDKYYWVKRDKYGNRKLLYGTQFGKPCLRYRAESDSARAVIGLKPLPDSEFMKCKD